jgi:RNA polymerase sigma factor (sigma-70 family)
VTVASFPAVPTSALSVPTVSFEAFFRLEYPNVVRAIAVVVGDGAEAEELVQEAMVRAYIRWGRVGGLSSPGGYVYRTAVNLHRSRVRRLRTWRRRAPARLEVSDETASQAIARTDLARALSRLPGDQRDALMLVEWFGLTSDQAGELLGIAPGSVRSRASRARAALRMTVEPGRGDDDERA